jgi:hypothetical protein
VTDWATISSLATAGGTLVLAVATFASVRSSNRSARISEQALLAGLKPVLVPSRLQDPPIKISWGDDHWTRVEGGRAGVELEGDVIYLSTALRNAGAGMAVLQGWLPWPERVLENHEHPPLDDFRRQNRDLYVPPDDVGFWQGAFRDTGDPLYLQMRDAVVRRQGIMVDLLYSDHFGGQRTISRFSFVPGGAEGNTWLCIVARHWNIDLPDPRSGDGR